MKVIILKRIKWLIKKLRMEIMSKLVRRILLCTVIIAGLIMPYTFSFSQNSSIKVLFIQDAYTDSAKVLNKLEANFGEKPKYISKINLSLDKSASKIDDSYDAVAIPLNCIDKTTQSTLQRLIKAGKAVYVYGDAISIDMVEPIFGEELCLRAEDMEEGYSYQKYNVLGIKKDTITRLLYGHYIIDESEHKVSNDFRNDPMRYFELIEQDLEKKFFTKTSLSTNTADAMDLVYRHQTVLTNFYSGATLIGTIDSDYYLYRNYNESLPDVNYYSVQTTHQQTARNGAWNKYLQTKHYKHYSNDNIYDWGPASTTSQTSFSFSIPWSLSIAFSNSNPIDVSTTASIANDWAQSKVTRTWGDLPDIVTFKPGTSWLMSTSRSLKWLHLTHESQFVYQGQYKTIGPIIYDLQYYE